MGVLTRVLAPRGAEDKRSSLDQLLSWDLGARTATGVKVNENSAVTYSAVWACVRLLSESIAGLPLILYEYAGRDRVRAEGHPLYFLLKEQPNPEMTSFVFRRLLVSHVCLWGNAFAEIESTDAGRVRALWPLRPDKMEKIERINGQLVYFYRRPDNVLQSIAGDRIMHWRGLGGSGLWGWSPVRAHMESIGLGLGTQEYGARFFGNGARPGMVLRHPGRLTPEAYTRLRNSFQDEMGGLSNAHRTKILEEGMEVTTIGVPPEEAQFLETRKFQITEIARIFQVPPHMIGDLERATFSNIEHQSINFVVHTLRPYMVNFEQAIQQDLLSPEERGRYFVKHLADALLRGDTKSRFEAYAIAIQNGLMTPNEGRAKEDLNAIEGGDQLLIPLNLGPLGAVGAAPNGAGQRAAADDPAPRGLPAEWIPASAGMTGGAGQRNEETTPDSPSGPAGPENRDRSGPAGIEERRAELRRSRQRVMNRSVRLFEDAATRLVKREAADIRRALPRYLGKRSASEFEEWLAGFYEDLRGVVPDYFRALMLSYAEEILAAVADEVGGQEPKVDTEWVEAYLANFAAVYTVGGEVQLRALLAEAEGEEAAAAAIAERLDGWEENRASKTAREQAFEAGNALALFGMGALGVREKVWTGGDCPLCRKLNGMRIPIDEPFLREGDTLEADDEETAPFPAVRTIGHPPLHPPECDCVILAG